eukprot:2352043-Prymnesium_polylepis.1
MRRMARTRAASRAMRTLRRVQSARCRARVARPPRAAPPHRTAAATDRDAARAAACRARVRGGAQRGLRAARARLQRQPERAVRAAAGAGHRRALAGALPARRRAGAAAAAAPAVGAARRARAAALAAGERA